MIADDPRWSVWDLENSILSGRIDPTPEGEAVAREYLAGRLANEWDLALGAFAYEAGDVG